VHAACRKVIQEPVTKKISATWRDDIVPANWRQRDDLTIDVGIGSGGRDEDIAYATRILEMQRELVANGFGGTMVTPQNIYGAITRLLTAMGVKNVQALFTDPTKAEGQPEAPPKDDPEIIKMQAEMEMKRQSAQVEMQISREKMEVEVGLAREKMQLEAQLAREKMMMQAEMQSLNNETVNISSNRLGGSLSS
jgi:hypothetical protein